MGNIGGAASLLEHVKCLRKVFCFLDLLASRCEGWSRRILWNWMSAAQADSCRLLWNLYNMTLKSASISNTAASSIAARRTAKSKYGAFLQAACHSMPTVLPHLASLGICELQCFWNHLQEIRVATWLTILGAAGFIPFSSFGMVGMFWMILIQQGSLRSWSDLGRIE